MHGCLMSGCKVVLACLAVCRLVPREVGTWTQFQEYYVEVLQQGQKTTSNKHEQQLVRGSCCVRCKNWKESSWSYGGLQQAPNRAHRTKSGVGKGVIWSYGVLQQAPNRAHRTKSLKGIRRPGWAQRVMHVT